MVSKGVKQKFDMQRFYLKELNDAVVKEQCQVKISNKFVALENLDADMDINRAWEILERIPIFQTKRDNIITS